MCKEGENRHQIREDIFRSVPFTFPCPAGLPLLFTGVIEPYIRWSDMNRLNILHGVGAAGCPLLLLVVHCDQEDNDTNHAPQHLLTRDRMEVASHKLDL